MKFLTYLLLAMSLMLTSCSYLGIGKSCCNDKDPKSCSLKKGECKDHSKDCKEGKCKLDKSCCKDSCKKCDGKDSCKDGKCVSEAKCSKCEKSKEDCAKSGSCSLKK